jgi:low temperature requirement protein LtrA
MVSRIILALQYLLVMWHVRRYENAKLPFILIAGTNFIAAAIYLGVTLLVTGAISPYIICSYVYSTFESQSSLAYRSFYVIAVFEIATNIAVSSKWKAVTFKGTHLVQRMSLLTLIILGEGVMTIVQKITTVYILL